MSFVQLINDMMNSLIPVSLLAKCCDQRVAANSIVKVGNWYLFFNKGTDAVSKLNNTDELQLREQMYARLLKQVGLA